MIKMNRENLLELKNLNENSNLDKKEIFQILFELNNKRELISEKIDELDTSEFSDDEKEMLKKFKDSINITNNQKIKEEYIKFQNLNDNEKKERIEEFNTGISFYQKIRSAFTRDVDIDPGRLLALVDGIFGMVITLLAFGVALPEITITTSESFTTFIMELIPNIGVVLVSFVLLSSFWIYHHEFMKIKTLNVPFLWLNIAFLACISFIPFTTSIIGSYSHFFYSEVIFGLNVFLTIISFLVMHYYAVTHNLLEEKISRIEMTYRINTFIILMILTMIVNLLDFFVSPNFIYLFFLVPVISTFRDGKINKFL